MCRYRDIIILFSARRSGKWRNSAQRISIATTPYSPLAGGRLARLPGETSKRLREDEYARLKYDAAAEQDRVIIRARCAAC